jgi:hypothetical protein
MRTSGVSSRADRPNFSRSRMLVVFLLFLTATAHAQRFPPAIWDDDDRESIAEPKVRNVADWYDFLLGTFGEPTLRLFDLPRHFRGLSGKPKEAENINAFDEAPRIWLLKPDMTVLHARLTRFGSPARARNCCGLPNLWFCRNQRNVLACRFKESPRAGRGRVSRYFSKRATVNSISPE